MNETPRSRSRHAYLVLAHNDPDMLNYLICRLVKTGDVYVHLDKKGKIRESQILNQAGIKVFREFKVNWGGFSMVEATRFLARKALLDGAERLTLLSGTTYPIVSDEVLEKFANNSQDFVDTSEVDLSTIHKTFRRRFTSRHFSFHVKQNIFGRTVRRLSREFWGVTSRLNPSEELDDIKLMLGSQWWSVTSTTYERATELLELKPQIEKFFRKIECSDESFFATIFYRVSENLIPMGTTYVKWAGTGQIQKLDKTSIDSAREKGFLFARKFTYEKAGNSSEPNF